MGAFKNIKLYFDLLRASDEHKLLYYRSQIDSVAKSINLYENRIKEAEESLAKNIRGDKWHKLSKEESLKIKNKSEKEIKLYRASIKDLHKILTKYKAKIELLENKIKNKNVITSIIKK